jgi:hypothetical protein
MSWATQGQIRLLERRLMRLADQSEKVLGWIEQRRELLDQMEQLDLATECPARLPAKGGLESREQLQALSASRSCNGRLKNCA